MKEGSPDQPVPIESQRVPLEREVVLRFQRFEGFIAEYSCNISMGGMFICSERPKAPGTEFSFELGLQDGFPLVRGRAVVVWTRRTAEGPDRPAGMGVRFAEIDDSSRRLIQRVVEEWVKEGGEPFDLETVVPKSAPVATPAEPAPPVDAPPVDQPAGGPPLEPPAGPRVIGVQSIGEARVGSPPTEAVRGRTPPPAAAAPSPFAAGAGAGPAGSWTPPTPEPGPAAAAALRGAAGARASRRRRLPLLAIAGLALVIAAGLLWRWRPGGPAVSETAQALAAEAAENAATDQDALAPVAAGAAPEGPAAGAAVQPAEASAAAVEAAGEGTPPGRQLAAVRDIRWRREGVVLVFEIATVGGVGASDYVSTPLGGGGSPRHLVRLLGVGRPFERSSITVGEPEVERVRTGYHQLAGGDELHLVFDLTGARVEMTGIEEGPGLLRLRFRAAR